MVLKRLLFFAFLATAFAEKCPTNKSNSKLFCYYGKLEQVDNCKCTHVILPPNSDVKSIEKLRQSLQGVKILITVHEFNEGLVQLLKNAKVDGLEINLQKINAKEDIGDFITTAKSKLGNDLVTVVSVPPRADLLAKFYDFKGLTKHTDAFILQTAFLGTSKNFTFHPSRLSGLWDMQNADTVVDLVTGLGAPLSKLVIAAPVQAFQFKLQNEEHTAVGSPALEVRSITRDELCEKMANSEWTLERDQDQAGPYIFRKDEWIAFDDPTSMDIKAKYARVRGLAGLALKDLSQDGGKKCGGTLLDAAYTGLSRQARAPRGAVLHSLEREILESPAKPFANIQLSPFRITRIVDVEGKVHTVRQDTRTEFECSRQGYFVHPRSCNRFYRCVKFNQLSEEYNVFEFDCPAGLAFDSKVEVCVWPGSLSDGSACSGSSEIAPVPKERYVCPHEPGYYADPENCRWFFACLDHGESGVMTPYEFRCPFGLVFDQARLVCEWPWLVPKCGSGAYQTSVQFFGPHGQATTSKYYSLDNFNGIGTLQPVALNGVSGKIEHTNNKVYSSFAGHGAPGADGSSGYYQHGQGNALGQGSLEYGLQFGAKDGLGGSQEFGQNHGSAYQSHHGASQAGAQGELAGSHGHQATSSHYQTHQGNQGVLLGGGSSHEGSSTGLLLGTDGFGQNHASSYQNHGASHGISHGQSELAGSQGHQATSSHYQTHQGNQGVFLGGGSSHEGSSTGLLLGTDGFGQNHASSYQNHGASHGISHGQSELAGSQGHQATSSHYQTHQGNQGVLLGGGSSHEGSSHGLLVGTEGFGQNHASSYQNHGESQGVSHGQSEVAGSQGHQATSSHYQTHEGNQGGLLGGGSSHEGSSNGLLVGTEGFGETHASSYQNHGASQGVSHGQSELAGSQGHQATSSHYQTHQGNQGVLFGGGSSHEGSSHGLLVGTEGFGQNHASSYRNHGANQGVSHGQSELAGSQGHQATSSHYQTHQGNQGVLLGGGSSHEGSSHGLLVGTEGFGENHASLYQNHGANQGVSHGQSELAGSQGHQATSSHYQTHQGNQGVLLGGGSSHEGSSHGLLVGTEGFGENHALSHQNHGASQGVTHGQSELAGSQGHQATSSHYQTHQGNQGVLLEGGSSHEGSSQGLLVETEGFGGNQETISQYQRYGGQDAAQGVFLQQEGHSQESSGASYQQGNQGSLSGNQGYVHGSRGSTRYQLHGTTTNEGSDGLLINSQHNSGESGSQFDRGSTKYQLNGFEQNTNQGSYGVLTGAHDVNVQHGVDTQQNSGVGYEFGSQYSGDRGSAKYQGNVAVNAQEINNGFSGNNYGVNHGSQAFGQQGHKYTNVENGNRHFGFGFASGGFGQGIQSVDFSGQQGEVYVNNQNLGSHAFSSQSNNLLNKQNVNIVGGGFSAVKDYGNHDFVQSVTPSTISVTTGIPTVTSVPFPSTVDLHQTGVVANVPELQVKIHSPSEVNVIHGVNEYVTTTTAPVTSTGYVYETPKVPFVDGQSYSKVEQSGYHYEKPSIAFEEKPQKTPLKEVVHNVFGVQRVESTGYQYPKPTITFEETKIHKPSRGYSYQHFNKGAEQQQHIEVPVVSTERTEPANSYSYQTFGHSDKKQYVKVEQPVHQIVEQPIHHIVQQPAVVQVEQNVHTQPDHSYSYQSFGNTGSNLNAKQEVVVQQPTVEEHVQQPKTGDAHSYSYQNFGHSQSNQYVNVEQPAQEHVELQPVVQKVVQPHLEVQKTIVQPAQSFSYSSFGKAHSNQYIKTEQQPIVQEVVQPHIELQKTVVQPAHSYSYSSFGKAQNNQYVKTEQQPIVQEVVQPHIELQKTVGQPAHSYSYSSFGNAENNQYVKTEQQPIVQEVVQPHIELQKTVVQPAHSYSYSSFGNAENNQYVKTEQQPIVQEVVQPHIELQKTVVQPAHSYSYSSFGKAENNKHVKTEQQQIVQEVIQPHIELQKTVIQPAHSYSYSSSGNAQSNQYINTEQQPIVQEVVQPHIELQKTVVQPAHSYSYSTFGKAQNHQYVKNEQQQPIVQEVVQQVQPIDQHVQKQPGHSYSYISFGTKSEHTKSEQPLVQKEVRIEQPIIQQTVVAQPVAVEQTVVQEPSQSYSYFGTHKQNHKYVNVEQPVHQETYVQQPEVQTYVQQPIEEKQVDTSYNHGNSYSYQSFGAKEQVQPEVNIVSSTITPVQTFEEKQVDTNNNHGNFYQSFGVKEHVVVQPEVNIVSSTISPVVYKEENNVEGYHYPQPLEPVHEEPFVAKKAYVTGESYYNQKSNLLGTYSISQNGGETYVSSTPAYEETYVSSTPQYQEEYVSSTPAVILKKKKVVRPTQKIYYQSTAAPEVLIDQTKRPIYVQTTPKKYFIKTAKQTVYVPPTEASYYLSSTPAPTYQSTLNTLIEKEPLKFYLYDSRLSSKSTTSATPEFISSTYSSTYKPLKTGSRPIARYEFSSLDDKYDNQYSSTPSIEVTSQRRRLRPTTPSNAYLPVKVTTSTPYIEVTTPFKVTSTPSREYLPSLGTSGQVLENYQAENYGEVISRRPVKVVKVIRPKSKAIVKINDFHPMLSAKLGGQCTCVSNTVSLKQQPIQVENYSIDDGDDGYVVDNRNAEEYDTQKIVEITPLPEIVSSTPKTVVVRKRVRPTSTVSYEETPVTKAAEYFIKSTKRRPIIVEEDDEPTDVEVKQAVKTGLKLVKAAAKQGAKEGAKEALADFDRYGPGGVRSRIETLQGIDCQRAGLFRHPTQCNKFYSCRWDCDKKKFTLHVFNCPVHLTFDSNLGACNWPSQGPACSGNTLLPSD